jgi:hypothetical protein
MLIIAAELSRNGSRRSHSLPRSALGTPAGHGRAAVGQLPQISRLMVVLMGTRIAVRTKIISLM